jgi:CRISPR-associated protein Csb2
MEALTGERWLPSSADGPLCLRLPVEGTLDALMVRHEKFLKRMGPDGLSVPPYLSCYQTVGYRRSLDAPPRHVAAFSLMTLDAAGYRAFDPVRLGLTVSGMMRHTVKVIAHQSGWSDDKIGTFILGHGEAMDAPQHLPVGDKRFAFLPLPSIESRGEGKVRVGSIRRLLLTSYHDQCKAEIAWARRLLPGQDMIEKKNQQPVALLSLIPSSEKMLRHYLAPASCWATVTPVVLPGYDDPAHYRRRLRKPISANEQTRLLQRLGERIDGLMRKAIMQAGFSPALAQQAELEWCKAGFWPGTDWADRYGVPEHLQRFPRFHLKLRWRDEQQQPLKVSGPLCLGGGRFFGLGLFASWPREG